jgi:lon-related putative ATP-dependent protease
MTPDGEKLKLTASQLRNTCDPSVFEFETTEDVKPLEGSVGQNRAVDAVEFGVDIDTGGFNIFASGPAGTGKNSLVKAHIAQAAENKPVPSDWCYVHNFADPNSPMALELPAGGAKVFAKEMEEVVKYCKIEIPKVFESDNYEKRRERSLRLYQKDRETLLDKAREKAEAAGFQIQLGATGMVISPVIEGKAVNRDEFAKLAEEEQKTIRQKSEALEEELTQTWKKLSSLDRKAREKIASLDQDIALDVIGHLLDALKEKYGKLPKVMKYLENVQDNIMETLDDFKSERKQPFPIPGLEIAAEPSFTRYSVNVIVDNSSTKGAPVVMESNPTFYNLFGRIDYQLKLGSPVTDFTLIKGGSLHKANGGFIIIQALELLLSYFSWETLKRSLKCKELSIENFGEQYRAIPSSVIKPEPIPLDVKVVLIGSPLIYYLLQQHEEDFRKLFKVKADFGIEMNRTANTVKKYASFVSGRCRDKNLKHFDRSAVARIVDYGSRLSEDQSKLSTRFMAVSDLISEANFWATKKDHQYVTGDDVQTAIKKKIYRSNMIEEKIKELIKDDIIMIDTTGSRIGQVNGISVIPLGDYMFGRPSRITARVFLGRSGVLDIEREVKLSGPIHSKGVLILNGYLHGTYGHDKPVTMSASICFEQGYEEIEGDSASCAELYAVLSALSKVPLKQNIAVTGSVNQLGEVQPVGAINHKIEGFFDICRLKRINGRQGVMIPRRNLKHLMLRDDVIEAVEKGKFHIWAVSTVEEGIEILTDIKAGKSKADGSYPKDTINFKVDERLKHLAETFKEFSGGDDGEESEDE